HHPRIESLLVAAQLGTAYQIGVVAGLVAPYVADERLDGLHHGTREVRPVLPVQGCVLVVVLRALARADVVLVHLRTAPRALVVPTLFNALQRRNAGLGVLVPVGLSDRRYAGDAIPVAIVSPAPLRSDAGRCEDQTHVFRVTAFAFNLEAHRGRGHAAVASA